MHENRETSGAPRPERERGRSAKVQSHKADTHALEESDRAIRIDEPDEQRRAIFGGAWGEKGVGQGEHRLIPHSPDTVRGMSVPRIERCASSRLARLLRGGSCMRESRSYGSVRGAISDGRPTATLGPFHIVVTNG